MSKPVKSNLTSKACGDSMGSNCVEWTGGELCSADLCKGNTTLTDVITAMDQRICGNSSTFACYTGNWVDFTSLIPTSGSGTGYSWTISNFGFSTGTGGSPTYNPQYKWTKDGNLLVRGGFSMFVNVTVPKEYIVVPFSLNFLSCLPSGWRSQYVTNNVDMFPDDGDVKYVMAAALGVDYPSGVLTLVFSYANGTLTPMRLDIDLGGTQFNLE